MVYLGQVARLGVVPTVRHPSRGMWVAACITKNIAFRPWSAIALEERRCEPYSNFNAAWHERMWSRCSCGRDGPARAGQRDDGHCWLRVSMSTAGCGRRQCRLRRRCRDGEDEHASNEVDQQQGPGDVGAGTRLHACTLGR